MNIIPTTPPDNFNSKPRVDFNKNNFDVLIWQKGYDVVHENAIVCPCKSKNSGNQSSCINCGGSGWLFVNAKQTKMVLSAMNMNTKYREWSQENIGSVSISALAEDECSFMDRVTVLDGNAIFGEVLFLKEYNSVFYWNSIYDIKEIAYIALYKSSLEGLKPLKYNIDYTYDKNKIMFLNTSIYYSLIDHAIEEQDISITIRYKHAPQFHVIDIPRETMQTSIIPSVDEAVNMPIHAIGRRSHYVIDAQNFDNTRIFRNDSNLTIGDLNPIKDNNCE